MRGFVREARAVVLMAFSSIVVLATQPTPPVGLQARPSGRQPRASLETEQPQSGSDPVQRTQIPQKLRDQSSGLSLVRPIPEYLEAANTDEHSACESTLYLQTIACDGFSLRPDSQTSAIGI